MAWKLSSGSKERNKRKAMGILRLPLPQKTIWEVHSYFFAFVEGSGEWESAVISDALQSTFTHMVTFGGKS